VEPTDTGEPTPDDWTPWSTGASEVDTPTGPEAGDASSDVAPPPTGATPSARAKRLAQGETSAAPRASRHRPAGDGLAGAAPPARSSLSIGGITAAVGGLVVVAGSLLEMVKVGLGQHQLTTTTLSTSYFDTDNGKVVAALGAVVLVLALATLVRPVSNMIPAIVVAACGLAAFGLALSDRLDLSSAGDDYRREFLRGNQLRGLVQVTVGPALYVVMAGGLIATIGAVLASRDR
jgi:hypothetical protein